MSELGIFLAEHEGRARREAARQERLVREAAAYGNGEGLATRLVHAVRQCADLRGYAMAQLRRDTPEPLTPGAPAVAPVTVLDIPEPAWAVCEPRQAT